MIFNVENTKGKKIAILDGMGKKISLAKEYDTETREVTMYLSAGGNKLVVSEGQVKTVKVRLPDSVIEVDGVRY